MDPEEFAQYMVEALSKVDAKTKAFFLILLENLESFNHWVEQTKWKEEDLLWIQEHALTSDDSATRAFAAYVIVYAKELMQKQKKSL